MIVCNTVRTVAFFKAVIFAGEAKFKFRIIKISKITNFKEFSTELVATIIYNDGFINSYACFNYASLLLRNLGYFEAANTASLVASRAALIVAKGSVSDN